MTDKERAAKAVELLEKEYPDAECSLEADEAYRLLISVRLAAQCTDARVNIVTAELFAKYPTLESLAQADTADIEAIVRPCGLGATKAASISGMTRMLVSEYGGVVPDTMEELLKLPGIGRKSANLILGDVYGKEAVVCDTHCIRITGKLGLIDTKDPTKAEMQLRKVLPMDKANAFCHRLVLHGRAVCVARRPNCAACVMAPICKSASDEANNK
ncbi:MAG: endonuclease III [Oscillospiraceae bacterium]|nr:endonuclease III [Oscillospiraceae bacterium]